MTDDLPYRVEYSKSARAKCQYCLKLIPKDILRIATIEQSPFHDGVIPNWHHTDCFFKRYHPKTTGDFDHFDNIRWEDQEYIRQKIEGGGALKATNSNTESSSSRYYKRNNVTGTTSSKENFKAECAKSDSMECCSCNKMIIVGEICLSKKDFESEEASHNCGQLDSWYHLECFANLRHELQFFDDGTDIPGVSNMSKEDKNKIKKALPKIDNENIPPKAKKIKLDSEDSREEKDLRNQQKKFFEIRDELFKLKKKELTKMLQDNNQRVPAGESNILDALADALLFGALERCSKCNDQFEFKSDTGYKCTGSISEWVLCDNITQDPKRRKFVIPDDFKMKYDFFASFKPQVQRRLLRITTPSVSSAVRRQSSPIKESSVNVDVTDKSDSQEQPQFIKDLNEWLSCTKVKLCVKDGGIVDPESHLQNDAHVYQRDNEKFTVTLGITDIQKKKNSYYKLQILKHDEKEKYWLFRSWGRIGTMIGNSKCESLTLEECIEQFESLFEKKTGNAWSDRDHFVKIPHKMYPIDIDHAVEDNDIDLLNSSIESELEKPVQDLMKLIFNEKEMKKAMLEYEIDMEKLPLGKISKKQIQKAFSVLSELLALVKSESQDRTKYIEASNKFYTLIPHDFGFREPNVIDTEKEIQAKSEMLESLREMQIAYTLLYTKTDRNKNPLDAHYKQLKTNIKVLDRESDEFKLIQKYAKNTHASTHNKYKLIVEEVFVVKRDGEESRFKPYEQLPNRKLLWHGSRVTNFASILSQGLMIAPPEAPRTGYMFGKGIYFADMVSKSANYCRTNSENSTGLLLLCDVALGNMYERFKADYNIDKPPCGYHSTWGRGKTQPDPEKSVKLKTGVEVPCGPSMPVDMQQKSELLYNEFIVYDVAQVKVEYLVKMKFEPTPSQSSVSIFTRVPVRLNSIFGGTSFAQPTLAASTNTTTSNQSTANPPAGGPVNQNIVFGGLPVFQPMLAASTNTTTNQLPPTTSIFGSGGTTSTNISLPSMQAKPSTSANIFTSQLTPTANIFGGGGSTSSNIGLPAVQATPAVFTNSITSQSLPTTNIFGVSRSTSTKIDLPSVQATPAVSTDAITSQSLPTTNIFGVSRSISAKIDLPAVQATPTVSTDAITSQTPPTANIFGGSRFTSTKIDLSAVQGTPALSTDAITSQIPPTANIFGGTGSTSKTFCDVTNIISDNSNKAAGASISDK